MPSKISLKQTRLGFKRIIVTLFSVLVGALLILITVNYFTTKINSSIRAFIYGESMYSKGEKDAAQNLNHYLFFSDSAYIHLFNESIAIPLGDRSARIAMENGEDHEIIEAHLLEGKNHEDDLGNIIWLFENFKHVSFMQRAHRQWQQADSLVVELDMLADEIFRNSAQTKLSLTEILYYNNQIFHLNAALHQKQNQFSSTLGEAARTVSGYLYIFDILVVFLIVAFTLFFLYFTIKKLDQKNKNLNLINQEMDKFVYSTSHDLKAPISSMQGLINIARKETDTEKMHDYFNIMSDVLSRQNVFIKDIIDLSKNKRSDISLKLIDAKAAILSAIDNHKFMDEATAIDFITEIETEAILVDEGRFAILLNNLISNAVKYHDEAKTEKFIKISLNKDGENINLVVEDNGKGIKSEYQQKVFDMFFVTDTKNNGSGLGLYIVADVLAKMDASIKLVSEWTKGTKFIITWLDFAKR